MSKPVRKEKALQGTAADWGKKIAGLLAHGPSHDWLPEILVIAGILCAVAAVLWRGKE